MAKDILLNESNEPVILNGDFRIGESELQEVALILQLRQGELKSDPILGVNMQHFIKSRESKTAIERKVKLHLERDNKRYDDVIKKINIKSDG
ncbi:hypothetical protein [Chryseobacterium sp.]|uniref:hypothetical protein n=1 Tax=Chryseobacterium sp. TaxID=1871047 RepID=UPI00289AFFE8|nr:hypothetical protein [Chryseobacterium sp.]